MADDTSRPLPPAGALDDLTNFPSTEEDQARILVVDDEALVRQILSDQLVEAGYLVSTAEDGEEALAKVATESPDLILLDIIMPKLDGFEVCRRLKSDERTILIPVVMVTCLTATQDRIQGIEVGADDFLSKPFNPQELITRVRSSLRLKRYTDELENAATVLFSLAASVEAKDPWTNEHCDRLARTSVVMGKTLGLPRNQLKALLRGAMLHDLGKIATPESILTKAGPLTESERAVIREHPIIGERICAPLKSLRLVLPIIRHHHERWDGSGYPDGLAGEAIPLSARIVQTVDIYDALTSVRSYRPAYSHEEACVIMREETAKGWRDPRLVEALVALTSSERMSTSPPNHPPGPGASLA
jgi:putative two-component system response regulator